MGDDSRPYLLDVKQLTTALSTPAGEVNLVDRVSFTLASGEVLALVGESGSGKTLTAMSIMRLLSGSRLRSSGTVDFLGRNLLELPEKAMRKIRGGEIALIPQDPMTALNPTFTIGHQIMETLRIHRGLTTARARARAVELLDLVQIPSASRRLDSYQHEFSGGMRQRVMVAIALSCDPRLVIADEATSALDVTTQAQVVVLLRELCAAIGTAMIFITHDLGLVAGMCDKINVMYSGRILESSAVKDFYRHQYSPYSRRLISAIPDPEQQRKTPLLTIEGNASSPFAGQTGCRFAPRCAHAKNLCHTDEPVLVDHGTARSARCWGTESGGWIHD